MSEPIKPGDLVMVVRADCEHEVEHIGRIFTVPVLRYDESHCGKCFHVYEEQWHVVNPTDHTTGYPVTHVKRIPPLSELEGEKQKEDLREPA